jgi:hypothetical protein
MSLLDDRMRVIARDEMGKFTSETEPADADSGPGRVAELEKQLAALTARVDELEKAAPAPAKRATRKTQESTE